MRSLLCFVIALLTTSVFAQRGKATYEEHSTLINDSVRQVIRMDLKKDRLIDRRYYVDKRPVGVWQEFDKHGKLVAERDFDKLRYGKVPEIRSEVVPPATEMEAETVKFTIIETMPQFPGGEAALFKFLSSTIKYPTTSMNDDESGTVLIVGIVDETGVWRTATVLRGAYPLLDYEAWRVCELMPTWTPGTQGGKPVKVQYNLPIRFVLR